MSDSGAGPDIVVAAMFAVAAILGVLALLPEGRLANAVGPVAAALVVLAVAGAAAIATMRASGVYGDGTSHWHHMSQLLVLAGGAVSLASAAVLFSAQRVAVLRAGLATAPRAR